MRVLIFTMLLSPMLGGLLAWLFFRDRRKYSIAFAERAAPRLLDEEAPVFNGKPLATIPISEVATNKRLRFGNTFLNAPVIYCFAILVSTSLWLLGARSWSIGGLMGLMVWTALAVMHFELSGATWAQWCEKLLRSAAMAIRR